MLGKRKRRTVSEDIFSPEARERKFSFGDALDKKKPAPKAAKIAKLDSNKQGDEQQKEEPGRDVATRDVSPSKQDKLKSKSSGGTQTSSTSTNTDIPLSSKLNRAPSMASKTFSSIVKKKHRHKDKAKEKNKVKKLEGKHKHKHHHHHKKHKNKEKEGFKKTLQVLEERKHKSKKESNKGKPVPENDSATKTPTKPSTPAKKDKVSAQTSPFSIVKPEQTNNIPGKSGDQKKSDLTMRIRSNSGDFAHNPFEFHSEDEETSSVTGTSTITQSTNQNESESVADMESVRSVSQHGDEDDEEHSENAESDDDAKTPKKGKTATTPKKGRDRSASSDSKSKIAGNVFFVSKCY